MSPTPEQWNERKEEILRLYIDEGWTLKPVMRKMVTPDFHPTWAVFFPESKVFSANEFQKNHKQHSHPGSAVASATLAQSPAWISERDPSLSQRCIADSDPPDLFAAEGIIPTYPSCQAPYPWQNELGITGSGFQTATTEQQQQHTQAALSTGDVGGQQLCNSYADQYYGQEDFNPKEYRDLARKRKAESTFGSPGHSRRIERGKRRRSHSSYQQPKGVSSCPGISVTDSPFLSHFGGTQVPQSSETCFPAGVAVTEGHSSWWLAEENDPFGATLEPRQAQNFNNHWLP
ncbi:MAG: hypothetical protein L6R39_001026 [Caloplaca ligustica]|nr:MAG: hypothetical protein L6R39_001026 [Caloplaca ligustica]